MIPKLTAAEVLRALQRDGWYRSRGSGSHAILHHPTKDGRVTVAVHSGKVIPSDTMKSILRQSGLSAEELMRLL